MTFIRAADATERAAIFDCICGGKLHKEPGTLYAVTLTCDTCGESVEYTKREWAQYADPLDD